MGVDILHKAQDQLPVGSVNPIAGESQITAHLYIPAYSV